jgi:cytochrome P450
VICSTPIEHGTQLGDAASRPVAVVNLAPRRSALLHDANDDALTLEAYFRSVVAERRTKPGDDIISSLVAIGSAAVQLAYATGALVFATADASKVERVAQLGADVIID